MMFHLSYLLLICQTFALPNQVPILTLKEDRMLDGSPPKITIQFPNGHQDNLILSQHEDAEDQECLYLGHLETENSACVAMTGCPQIDDLELTIFSEQLEQNGRLKWLKNGTIFFLDSPLKLGMVDRDVLIPIIRADNSWVLEGSDEEINEPEDAEEMEIESGCRNGACDDEIQRTHVLKYKLVYDGRFLAKHGNDESTAKKVLREVMTHTQAHFCHESLGSKIKLKRKCAIELFEDENWPANNESLEKCGKVAQDHLGTGDLLICFGFHSADAIPAPQFGGVSYVGTVCNTALSKDFKCQLNMWWDDPSTTAAVVAHELGHSLGMHHDFDPPHDAAGCDKTGLMSYGDHPMKWSTCSRADFEAHYLQHKSHWCMPRISNPCP